MSSEQPPSRLDGKVAIVTGASRGIGLTLARAFAQAGCAVMLVARDRERLARAHEEVGRISPQVAASRCDVAVPEQVEAMVRETAERFGTVDILINNAGVRGPVGPAWNNEPDAWRRAIEVNLLGTYLCCKAVLPIMRDRRRGKIINMAGRGAHEAWPNFSAYGVSKTAVVRLTETLAAEAKPFNVQINIMAPGANDTDLFRQAAEHEPSMLADLPTDREKPARLALFLASERSDHITGRFIHVNQDWAAWTAQDLPEGRYMLRRVPT